MKFKGGWLILFVREDIPSNLVEAEVKPIESFYIELKLRNDKWLLNCSYNPHKNTIGNHFKALSDFLGSHSSTYKKVLILGDINVEVDDQNIKTFCDSYSLTSLIKQSACYKNHGFEKFCNITLKTLDKYAPRKAKHARGSQMPFMTKNPSKNITKRPRLRNKYLKNNNEENMKLYAKQINYCFSFIRKTKKAYYENLGERQVYQ